MGSGAFGAPGTAFGGGSGAFAGGGEEQAEAISDWQIERELARGGMGVVYLGRRTKEDGSEERAAVKVMLTTNESVNPKRLKRFLREIESTSRLDHPAIVKILDSGEFRGYPYFAMEYIEGKPLDRMLKDDLDLEIGMEILEKVARAIHYAHDEGVIHRDLKPANVIVRDDMEPRLTDFGLAKDRDNQSVLTKTGAVLGTPYYLSPEQASGRSSELDRRADIYSLGVIMYELATGRLPFVGNTTVELYNRIIHDEPVPPSKIKPQLTKALENVCLKAMAKEPEDRFQTASDFADDIAALLSGGSVTAKADGKFVKWAKRMKRRGSLPVAIGATVTLLVLVLGGLVLRFKQQESQRHARAVETEFKGLEDSVQGALEGSRVQVEDGWVALGQGNVPGALQAANDALSKLGAVAPGFEGLEYEAENGEPAQALLESSQAPLNKARAQALLLRASAAMQDIEKDSLAAAKKDLEEVLQEKTGLDPKSAAAQIVQGELLILEGSLGPALKQFEEAAAAMPNSVRARYGQARIHLLQERATDAISALSGALQTLDTAPAAPSDQEGQAEVQREELSEQERLQLRELLYVDRAQARLLQGGSDSLEKALADADEADKAAGGKSWRARATKGLILARRGHVFAALDHFEEGIKLSKPAGPRALAQAYTLMAEGCLICDLPEAATNAARKAVELDPASLLPLVQQAETSATLLDYQKAKEFASLVAGSANKRHWKAHARALRVHAALVGAEGSIPDAREYAKKSLNLDESGSEARLLLGRIELERYFDGQYLDSAERLLREVAKQRSDSAAARRCQGLVDLQKFSTDPQRAERRFQEALALDPTDPWTLSVLAKVYGELAQQTPEGADELQKKSAREWERSLRYERDVRRDAGWAYAQGLRYEKLAQVQSGHERAEMLTKAQRAYHRATWLCPTHTHAYAGLASIGLQQRANARVEQMLKKAVEANPKSTYIAVLNAYHLATADGFASRAREANEALESALARRGETSELLRRKLFVDHLRQAQSAEAKKPALQIEEIKVAFAKLRERDPLNTSILEGERALLVRLVEQARRRGRDHLDAMRAFQERQRVVRDEGKALDDDLEERTKRALEFVKKAQEKLDAGEALSAVEPADRAVRANPYLPEAWTTYARALDRSDDLWAALAAGIRAAWLDESYLSELFALLRKAGTEPVDEGTSEIAAHLQSNEDIYPLHPDVRLLMEAAPLVARSLVMDLESGKLKASFKEEAKQVFEKLEEVVDHDPTRLLSHGMVGALAFAVERDDYAVQHLLFLSEVLPQLGEAYYLSAVASARNRVGPRHANDVLAIRCLQAATKAGFPWEELSQEEGSINRLRKSELWNNLERDLESVIDAK